MRGAKLEINSTNGLISSVLEELEELVGLRKSNPSHQHLTLTLEITKRTNKSQIKVNWSKRNSLLRTVS